MKLTEKSDRCPRCESKNGEAYDDEYYTPNLVQVRVFNCNDCGYTTDFAWYDNGSKINSSAVIDNLNSKWEEEQ